MVRELLAFLEKADKEFKSTITTEICIAAEKYVLSFFLFFSFFILIEIN